MSFLAALAVLALALGVFVTSALGWARFFGLEHATMMLVAQRFSTSGAGAPEKLPARASAIVWSPRATLAMLAPVASSIPWPGLAHGRPLLRSPRDSATIADLTASELESLVRCVRSFAGRHEH